MAFLAPFIPAIIGGVATIASTIIASKSSGKSPSIKQKSLQTKDQQEMAKLISDAIKNKEGPLADILKGFDKDAFDEGVNKPALQNFQDNILPLLQEKFSANGYQGTPTAARELGKAGSSLQNELSKLLYQSQLDSQKMKSGNLMDLLRLHQSPSTENVAKQGNPGLAPTFAKIGGDITGNLAAEAYKNYNAPSAISSGGSGYNASFAQAIPG